MEKPKEHTEAALAKTQRKHPSEPELPARIAVKDRFGGLSVLSDLRIGIRGVCSIVSQCCGLRGRKSSGPSPREETCRKIIFRVPTAGVLLETSLFDLFMFFVSFRGGFREVVWRLLTFFGSSHNLLVKNVPQNNNSRHKAYDNLGCMSQSPFVAPWSDLAQNWWKST